LIEITKILIKDVNDHLGEFSLNLKINNIWVQKDDWRYNRPEIVKLGVMTHKRNVFLDYLESEGITLVV
jgi:hypothetical protein